MEGNAKEFADFKKRNNMLCQLALTLDATSPMLMSHVCVVDDGIVDGEKAWKLSIEISELGDADSGDFVGTAGSTAARRI